MDIGENIKELRNKNNLTQEELATKTGLSKNAIWNYENNKRKPNIEILNKIANALNVTVNDLIGNEEIEEAKEIDLSSIPTKDLIKELNKRNDFKVTLGVVSDE